MSDMNLEFEAVLLKIKAKLITSNVKLWLPPFRDNQTSEVSEDELKVLADSFCSELHIEESQCIQALKYLQKHAIDKLQSRQYFENTGDATLKIRLSGEHQGITVQVPLNETIAYIQKQIESKTNIPSHRWKLISHGKVLTSLENLSAQGIVNGSSVLAVKLEEQSSLLEDKNYKEVESLKKDLRILADRAIRYNDVNLRLEDQNGKTINLPFEEREALIISMTLHERGRAALKDGDFALALVMLLEAVSEFKCDSISFADNFAVLNLDIAWCYLCLKSLMHLPDAEARLKLCETSFVKCYGPRCERLLAIKGTSGAEGVLFMRLHLLQGIVLFYKNKRWEALRVLQKAQEELEVLKIDNKSLSALMELGLTAAEARLGLRATYGSVNDAYDYMMACREVREKVQAQDREQRAMEKRRKRYGKCLNGMNVNIAAVDMLLLVGYKEKEIVRGLIYCNNNVEDAVRMIEDLDPSISPKQFLTNAIEISSFKCFPYWLVKMLLKKHNNNVLDTIKELDSMDTIDFREPEDSSSEPEDEKEAKRVVEEAFARVMNALNTNVDDYLDLSLEQEEMFLQEYLALYK